MARPRRTQLRPTTSSGYRASMERYVRPHLGTVPLSRLDRRMLERLYARLLASGGVNGKSLSPRTVQLAHAILHRALEDAKLDGLLDDNPAAMARPPKRDPAEVELLEQQTPIKVVSERLGHATIAMTMDIYAHVMPAMDEDAVTRLDATIHGDTEDDDGQAEGPDQK